MHEINFIWPPELGRASFVVTETNSAIIKWIESYKLWPDQQMILVGQRYSGKTHIGQIWAELAKDHPHLLVDEIENYTEEQIIQILHLSETDHLAILWCSQIHPKNLSYCQYIQTRLSSGLIVEVPQPCENLFRGIFRKRCNDFGLQISDELLDYIANRVPITFASLHDFIFKLNRECLIQQKVPSIALVTTLIR